MVRIEINVRDHVFNDFPFWLLIHDCLINIIIMIYTFHEEISILLQPIRRLLFAFVIIFLSILDVVRDIPTCMYKFD